MIDTPLGRLEVGSKLMTRDGSPRKVYQILGVDKTGLINAEISGFSGMYWRIKDNCLEYCDPYYGRNEYWDIVEIVGQNPQAYVAQDDILLLI